MRRRDVISLSLIKSPVWLAGAQSDEVITLVEKPSARECPRTLADHRDCGVSEIVGTITTACGRKLHMRELVENQ